MKSTIKHQVPKSIQIISFCAYTLLSSSNLAAQANTLSTSEKVPEFHSQIEKENWLKANPNSVYYKIAKEKALVSNGFPEFVSTGNNEFDEAVYARKKEEWIASHPEEYKIMLEQKINE